MQSYEQIQKQIEVLQRQAEKLRQQEIPGVVARIKAAIAHYGLTAEQLGFGGGTSVVAKPKKKATIVPDSAKYSDGRGNVWGGRGPRPRWLRDALAEGRTLQEFEGGAAHSPVSLGKENSKAKPSAERKVKVRYRDENGNAWSGRGSRPRWLTAALTAGATLEQFAV